MRSVFLGCGSVIGGLVLVLAGCGADGGGGSGGQGGVGGAPCDQVSDCPDLGPCADVVCRSGSCSYTNKPAGVSCGADATCNGAGECDECKSDADCPNGVECGVDECQSGMCVTVWQDDGTPCSSGLCNGAGSCIPQCTDPLECGGASVCHDPACVQGVCAETTQPDGTMCLWNDLPIATCNTGSCRVCKDAACDAIDTHEPNDDQATAFDLGEHSDCDHYGFCAALTDGDVDWYTYHGSDSFGCNVAPSVDFDAGELRVCQYWHCDSVGTTTTCPAGTTADTAPGGQPGCCSTEAFSFNPCTGGAFDSEDARVWIKVERTGGSGCTPYALGIEF